MFNQAQNHADLLLGEGKKKFKHSSTQN